MLNSLFKWINDNKDVLGWLFGSGVLLVLLTGLYKLIFFLLKEVRGRKIRTVENFPFKIIPPGSNVAKEVLGGSDNDLLADRNIPYQQRVSGRSIRLEIETLLSRDHWVLVTGKTGIGKTREAVHVAESLNKEGWTVLFLTREKWLAAPSKLPAGVPERKLLFVLDDLNRKVYASRVEQSPMSEDSILQPINVPLQERMFEMLTTFEKLCGKNEILVIATARDEKYKEFPDEPSEWDKLEYKKYDDFWKRFTLFPISEADDEAEEHLLKDIMRSVGIKVKTEDLPAIVQRNDGTFSNLVENLRTANNQNTQLQAETFRDTLHGTWSKRYQDALAKNSFTKYIFDAVDLARSAKINLTFSNIFHIANLLCPKTAEKLKFIINLRILRQLIRQENILAPRDGQIEAKGYKLNVDEYLPLLSIIFYRMYVSRKSFTNRIIFGTQLVAVAMLPQSVYTEWDQNNSTFGRFWATLFSIGSILNNLALAYGEAGFIKYEEQLNTKALLLKNRDLFQILFSKKNIAITWTNQGYVYLRQGQYDKALSAFQKAIKLDAKYANAWNGLGGVFHEQFCFVEAIQAFRKAVEIRPKYPAAWGNLGYLYRDLNQYGEAVHALQRSIELDTKYAYPWNGLGNVYRDMNLYDDAIHAYQKAIEINPHYAYPFGGLGIVYLRLKKYEEARAAFQKFVDLVPEQTRYNMLLIPVLKKLGLEQEAAEKEQSLRPVVEKEFEYTRAVFEAICGNVPESMRLLELAKEKNAYYLEWARKDPAFDEVRDDPCFQELLNGHFA